MSSIPREHSLFCNARRKFGAILSAFKHNGPLSTITALSALIFVCRRNNSLYLLAGLALVWCGDASGFTPSSGGLRPHRVSARFAVKTK